MTSREVEWADRAKHEPTESLTREAGEARYAAWAQRLRDDRRATQGAIVDLAPAPAAPLPIAAAPPSDLEHFDMQLLFAADHVTPQPAPLPARAEPE